MSLSFKVVGFDKYQHYKTRTPPWIKLYNHLLEDYAFGRLPDAGKAHLVAIWLLASRLGNCMPLDGAWVARRINATEAVDLDALCAAGFLETLAPCKQDACPEREGETERETEGEGEGDVWPDPDDLDFSDFGKRTYPEDFEIFWRDYPNDPIMSKPRAWANWEKLDPEDRKLAHAALAPFRAYCARDPTYRPVHAERFLSQRRFEGFVATPRTAEAPLNAMWDGAAAPLVAEIGASAFQAYFGEATFAPGPPARIRIARPILRELAREKFAAALTRVFAAGWEIAAERGVDAAPSRQNETTP